MAIEPISTLMTTQAASYNTPKVEKSAAPAEKDVTEASAETQAAAKVDATINAIENANQKGSASYNDQTQGDQTGSTEQLRKAVEKMRKSLTNEEAIFGFHDDTNRVTIKIVDKKTKEVIKELPPEKTLDMIARVWDMAGILIDEKR